MFDFHSARIVLVGPLPPPPGGMANQTRQLATLLSREGASVNVVRTNAPYRPGFVEHLRGVRSLCRLAPYVVALRRAARGAWSLRSSAEKRAALREAGIAKARAFGWDAVRDPWARVYGELIERHAGVA